MTRLEKCMRLKMSVIKPDNNGCHHAQYAFTRKKWTYIYNTTKKMIFTELAYGSAWCFHYVGCSVSLLDMYIGF